MQIVIMPQYSVLNDIVYGIKLLTIGNKCKDIRINISVCCLQSIDLLIVGNKFQEIRNIIALLL